MGPQGLSAFILLLEPGSQMGLVDPLAQKALQYLPLGIQWWEASCWQPSECEGGQPSPPPWGAAGQALRQLLW